jgi:glycerol kinase
LVWNLTGGPQRGVHVTDVTNAGRTMLMDLDTLQWDSELIDIFGVPTELLPQIVASAHPETLGRTSARGPLGAEVPITAVLGDQQAALVGQVCFDPGDVKTTYGTGNFILVNTGSKVVRSTGGLLSTVAYQFGDDAAVYALEGAVAHTGSTLQWLRDEMGVLTSAAESERLAGDVPDNGGVYMVPAFSGLLSPQWRPDARGVVVGLSRHSTAAHLVRAALESICFQTRDVLESMEQECGQRFETMKVDGGVTANNLCMQLQADILGVPVTRPAVPETTAAGAAYAAGLAVGVWDGVDALREIWTASATWSPTWNEGRRSHAIGQWRRAVDRTLDWVDHAPTPRETVPTAPPG